MRVVGRSAESAKRKAKSGEEGEAGWRRERENGEERLTLLSRLRVRVRERVRAERGHRQGAERPEADGQTARQPDEQTNRDGLTVKSTAKRVSELFVRGRSTVREVHMWSVIRRGVCRRERNPAQTKVQGAVQGACGPRCGQQKVVVWRSNSNNALPTRCPSRLQPALPALCDAQGRPQITPNQVQAALILSITPASLSPMGTWPSACVVHEHQAAASLPREHPSISIGPARCKHPPPAAAR